MQTDVSVKKIVEIKQFATKPVNVTSHFSSLLVATSFLFLSDWLEKDAR